MKRLFGALLCVTLIGGGKAFAPARPGEHCTPLQTLTAGGSFTGMLCVDSDTQTLRMDGTLTVNGHPYNVDATGTIVLEKESGEPVYTISGTETINDHRASTIGSLNVNASAESVADAAMRFAKRVMNTRLP